MTKTAVDTERDYVDQRLCGVNDMTFKEWLSYQDQILRYYSTYQYDSGLYEEDYYPSEDESSDESSEEDDESDDDNDDRVCLILEKAIAVVTPEARIAMVNVAQTDIRQVAQGTITIPLSLL